MTAYISNIQILYEKVVKFLKEFLKIPKALGLGVSICLKICLLMVDGLSLHKMINLKIKSE